MTVAVAVTGGHGVLLPESVLGSAWFAVLSTFVALNTIMYCALAVAKALPKVYVSDWFTTRNRRAQSRSIYPEGWGRDPDSGRTDGQPDR